MNRLERPSTGRERLIVALDFPTADEALGMVARLGEEILWVKVGLELFCSAGPAVVERLAGRGKRIFLDLKFHDIPNTTARAVAAVSRLPVQLITLHAAAGGATLEAACQAVANRSDLGLLAVTRLTSRAEGGTDYSDVADFAEMAVDAGIFGLVCPAPSLPFVRMRVGERLGCVCPGIRPPGAVINDQIHVATPEGAVRQGADWIVVGRPITQAEDPEATAAQIVRDLEGGE